MTLSTGTADDLATYRTREAVLVQLRDALAEAPTWDAFAEALARRDLPEARVRQLLDVPVPMDLHLHSTCSDGQVPARKLAWLARAIGLKTVAVADHDAIDGVRPLYAEATLLGVAVLPAVELSTDHPGLELLVYWPDAGRFFDFLTTPRGTRFAKHLERKQQAVHALTEEILESVNRWLRRQGIPADQAITPDEVDAFFGGQRPWYPGTLCVLGLKRLDAAARDALGIRDPRAFNTKVITPAVRRLRGGAVRDIDLRQAVADVKKQLAAMRRSRAGAVAILPHPKELVTKGKMSIGKVARTLETLVEDIGLDGIEIGTSRDSGADVRVWHELVDDTNAKIAASRLPAPGPLLVASYASDFHVLGPGRASGEITLGFGLLDERPDHRRGNLRPQTSPEAFLDALRRRAAHRAAHRAAP